MATNAYGFTYPLSDAQVDVPNDALQLADSIGPYTVDSFTNAGQRDSFITQPQEGQWVWLRDIKMTTYYNGSVWIEHRSKGAALPATAEGYGNGQNSITATSAQVLPSFPADVSMVNPHPSRSLRCQVVYGCWLVANGATVRGVMTSYGVYSLPVPPITNVWGQVPLTGDIGSVTIQRKGTVNVDLPPGTTTFQWKAYRDAAIGSPMLNYATISVIPQCYL